VALSDASSRSTMTATADPSSLPERLGRHAGSRSAAVSCRATCDQRTARYPATVELIEAASAEFERVVRLLPAGSWDRPTPSEVSVRELVEHVVIGNRFAALLLTGVGRDEARAMLSGDPLGDAPVTAVVESARHQAQAFTCAPPEQVVPHPNGDIPAAAFLRFRLVDLVVHAWDLLRGASLDERLDPLVVERLLTLVEPHLHEMLAFGSYGEGPSGTLPPWAPAQARLLDWFGRRP
jgi:uncharacterized protein (TIGR03086 family)